MPMRCVNGARNRKHLQLGAFMIALDHGLGTEKFDRISSSLAAILRYVKDKVLFHIDEVMKHMFKTRGPHEDIFNGGWRQY